MVFWKGIGAVAVPAFVVSVSMVGEVFAHDPPNDCTGDHSHYTSTGEYDPDFHFNNGGWFLIDNGLVEVGFDIRGGASIALLREIGGQLPGINVVNNWRYGRQFQMNVRANRDFDAAYADIWNPTQAGDGGFTLEPLLFEAQDSLVFAKIKPRHFLTKFDELADPFKWHDPANWEVPEVLMYMVVEFLDDPLQPGVKAPAILVRGYHEYGSVPDATMPPGGWRAWSVNTQSVLPALISEWAHYTGNYTTYSGSTPWASPLAAIDPDGPDFPAANKEHRYFGSEGWSFLREKDFPTRGIGQMSHSMDLALEDFALASTLVGSGDHTNYTRQNAHRDVYPIATQNGRNIMLREAETIVYLGDVADGRDFFAHFRTRPSGAYSKDFGVFPVDGSNQYMDDLRDLDLNGRFVTLEDEGGGDHVINIGRDGNNTADISIPRRTFGEGVYKTDIRFPTTSPHDTSLDSAGLAIFKAGGTHAGGNVGHSTKISVKRSGFIVVSQARPGYDNDPPSASDFVKLKHNVLKTKIANVIPGQFQELKVVATQGTYPGHDKLEIYFGAPGASTLITTIDPSTGLNWPADATDSMPAGYVSLIARSGATVGPPQDPERVTDENDKFVSFRGVSVTPTSGDATPPDPVTAFQAEVVGGPTRLSLNWTNPVQPNDLWRWTRVVRRAGPTPPVHWRDGYPVYEGKLDSYVDADVEFGQEYSYAAYTVDHSGNFSDPLTLTRTIGAAPTVTATASPATMLVGGNVDFSVVGVTGASSWQWDFGDGATSTVESPYHAYSTAGVYSPSVTVTKAGVDYTHVLQSGVTVYDWVPDANAAADFAGPTQGTANWEYRQGSMTLMPTYSTSGSEDRWIASDGRAYVSATAQAPSLNVNAIRVWTAPEDMIVRVHGSVTLGSPMTHSDGVTIWVKKNSSTLISWTLDGNGETANGAGGAHLFDLPDVALLAGDEIRFIVSPVGPLVLNPTARDDRCIWDIDIEDRGDVPAPVASFEIDDTTVDKDDVVTFTSTSAANPSESSFSWDFDDGSPFGSGEVVSHAFSQPGHYDVTLTVDGPWGTSSEVHSVIVREKWSSLDAWGVQGPWYFDVGEYDQSCSDALQAMVFQSAWGTEGRFVGTGTGVLPYITRTHMKPGEGDDAVRSWKALESGDVHILGDITHLNPNGDGVRMRFIRNNVEVILPVFIGAGDTSQHSFEGEFHVEAGDSVEFRLDSGPASSATADLTLVTLTVHGIPTP